MFFISTYIIYLMINKALSEIEVSPKLSKVWGPGLIPEKIVMPARYFFIEPRNINNVSITRPLGKPFQIVADGATKTKKPCRLWTTVLDRKDGSYIVRYKLYEPCAYMKISIMYNNEHIAQSPYVINSMVYPDNCMCPKGNINEFLDLWECEVVPKEITRKLKVFSKINWDDYREKVRAIMLKTSKNCKKTNYELLKSFVM